MRGECESAGCSVPAVSGKRVAFDRHGWEEWWRQRSVVCVGIDRVEMQGPLLVRHGEEIRVEDVANAHIVVSSRHPR